MAFLIPSSTDDVRAKRVRRKEARPGELLQAALELFVEKGFAATRAEEVAARAGVSKGTLFLYFPSKEELFKAVVRENIAGRFTEWNEEFDRFEGSTADMLRYFMRMWWERVGATKVSGITKLIMGEASNFPEIAAFYQHEVIEPGHSLIERMLRRGVTRGEFHVPDVEYATYGLIAPMIFLTMTRHSGACLASGEPIDAQRFLESQATLLLEGFLVRAAGTPAGTAPPSPSNSESSS